MRNAPGIWNRQPQVPVRISSAPIAKDLAFLAPLSAWAATRDLVSGSRGTPTGLASRIGTQNGTYPIFGSSDNVGGFPAIPEISGTTPVTIAWTQQVTSIANGYPNVMAWTPTGATYRFLIICGPLASYSFCAGPQNSLSSTASWEGAIGASAVGRHNNFVLQIKAGTDSSDRTTFELFRDGVKITRDAAPTSFGSATTSEFRIGNRTGGDGFQGGIGNFHIWRRVLTDAEALAWTRNPYITLASVHRRIFLPSSSGGTIYNQNISGSITGSGLLIRNVTFGKGVVGSLSASGTVNKMISRGLSGAVTGSGSPFKASSKQVQGSVAGVGILSASTGAEMSIAGSITATGTVARAVQYVRSYSAAITMAGTVAKRTFKSFSGTIQAIGTMGKGMFVSLAGSITASGILSSLKFTPTVGTFVTSSLRSIRRFIGRR